MSINNIEPTTNNTPLIDSQRRGELLSGLKNMSFDKNNRIPKGSLDNVFGFLEKEILGTEKGAFKYEGIGGSYYISYLGVKLDVPLKGPANLIDTANYIDSVIDKHYFGGKKTHTKATHEKGLGPQDADLRIASDKTLIESIKSTFGNNEDELRPYEDLIKLTGDKRFREIDHSLPAKFAEFFNKVGEKIKTSDNKIKK